MSFCITKISSCQFLKKSVHALTLRINLSRTASFLRVDKLFLYFSRWYNSYNFHNCIFNRSIYGSTMKFAFPMPGGGSGMTLFSKLIRTKDLRDLQGDDPNSTKPKLTVSLKVDVIWFWQHRVLQRCIPYPTSEFS